MGIQVLQFWLLLIALLGLIDKSITTFTNYKDTLNEAINETTRLVNTRKAATMKLEEGRSPRTRGEMIEVGEKIAGDYPGTLKPEIYDEDNGYEIKKNIEERLYMPLYRIQTHNVLKGQPDHGKFRDLNKQITEDLVMWSKHFGTIYHFSTRQ
ncbi:hypothetical protein PCANC_17363 [Puccinia coronata f. sp. avenae]|uniref:Uncharacterized protein n=1 Tax=Puccinia coronata f. sp. avenae TaxID=200324 RepID=A0A2N5U903_9BASI|nr:hypothetical protein PCANC_17363 [Puccinia coronata f. sp. avenae]PLW34227.1 hypothetical protein PCASD_15024 [Puccinia coronata f. sp. avenae]